MGKYQLGKMANGKMANGEMANGENVTQSSWHAKGRAPWAGVGKKSWKRGDQKPVSKKWKS